MWASSWPIHPRFIYTSGNLLVSGGKCNLSIFLGWVDPWRHNRICRKFLLQRNPCSQFDVLLVLKWTFLTGYSTLNVVKHDLVWNKLRTEAVVSNFTTVYTSDVHEWTWMNMTRIQNQNLGKVRENSFKSRRSMKKLDLI